MLVLRPQLLEEIGDANAGPVGEVLGFVPIFSVITARVAHDEVSESFEVAALELPAPLLQVKLTRVRIWQQSCAAACARSTPAMRPDGKLE